MDAYADAVAAAQPERDPAGEAMRRLLGSLAALARTVMAALRRPVER